jgi:hypothetical protein
MMEPASHCAIDSTIITGTPAMFLAALSRLLPLRTDLHGPYKKGTFTMKSSKTLMIAAAAALTIGAGAAMAQSQVPSSGEGTYYSQPPTVTHSQDQAGSSDVRTGYQVAWDYSTLANPG